MAGTQYVGTAGQLAVMSELSLRGYNVAIPQIDKGDDVFAVNDATGAMWRVQVKTSQGRKQKKSDAYHFRIRQSAIATPSTPELHFVFACRGVDVWRFVVVPRAVLANYVTGQKVGTAGPKGTYRNFTVVLHHTGKVVCSKVVFTHHLNDWISWPAI